MPYLITTDTSEPQFLPLQKILHYKKPAHIKVQMAQHQRFANKVVIVTGCVSVGRMAHG
jgi:hypothetical protein